MQVNKNATAPANSKQSQIVQPEDLPKNPSCNNCSHLHSFSQQQRQNILAVKRLLMECSASLSQCQAQFSSSQTEIQTLKEQLWLSNNKINNLALDNSTLKEQLEHALSNKSENRDLMEKLQSAQSMAECYEKQLNVLRNVNEQLLASMQQMNRMSHSQSSNKASPTADELLLQKEKTTSLRNQLLQTAEESDKIKREMRAVRDKLSAEENKNKELINEITAFKAREKSAIDTLMTSLVRSKSLVKKPPYLGRLCQIFQVTISADEDLDLQSILNDDFLEETDEGASINNLKCEVKNKNNNRTGSETITKATDLILPVKFIGKANQESSLAQTKSGISSNIALPKEKIHFVSQTPVQFTPLKVEQNNNNNKSRKRKTFREKEPEVLKEPGAIEMMSWMYEVSKLPLGDVVPPLDSPKRLKRFETSCLSESENDEPVLKECSPLKRTSARNKKLHVNNNSTKDNIPVNLKRILTNKDTHSNKSRPTQRSSRSKPSPMLSTMSNESIDEDNALSHIISETLTDATLLCLGEIPDVSALVTPLKSFPSLIEDQQSDDYKKSIIHVIDKSPIKQRPEEKPSLSSSDVLLTKNESILTQTTTLKQPVPNNQLEKSPAVDQCFEEITNLRFPVDLDSSFESSNSESPLKDKFIEPFSSLKDPVQSDPQTVGVSHITEDESQEGKSTICGPIESSEIPEEKSTIYGAIELYEIPEEKSTICGAIESSEIPEDDTQREKSTICGPIESSEIPKDDTQEEKSTICGPIESSEIPEENNQREKSTICGPIESSEIPEENNQREESTICGPIESSEISEDESREKSTICGPIGSSEIPKDDTHEEKSTLCGTIESSAIPEEDIRREKSTVYGAIESSEIPEDGTQREKSTICGAIESSEIPEEESTICGPIVSSEIPEDDISTVSVSLNEECLENVKVHLIGDKALKLPGDSKSDVLFSSNSNIATHKIYLPDKATLNEKSTVNISESGIIKAKRKDDLQLQSSSKWSIPPPAESILPTRYDPNSPNKTDFQDARNVKTVVKGSLKTDLDTIMADIFGGISKEPSTCKPTTNQIIKGSPTKSLPEVGDPSHNPNIHLQNLPTKSIYIEKHLHQSESFISSRTKVLHKQNDDTVIENSLSLLGHSIKNSRDNKETISSDFSELSDLGQGLSIPSSTEGGLQINPKLEHCNANSDSTCKSSIISPSCQELQTKSTSNGCSPEIISKSTTELQCQTFDLDLKVESTDIQDRSDKSALKSLSSLNNIQCDDDHSGLIVDIKKSPRISMSNEAPDVSNEYLTNKKESFAISNNAGQQPKETIETMPHKDCPTSPKESRRFSSVYDFVTKIYGPASAYGFKKCFDFVRQNECIPPLKASSAQKPPTTSFLKRPCSLNLGGNDFTRASASKLPRLSCESNKTKGIIKKGDRVGTVGQMNIWTIIHKSYKSSRHCTAVDGVLDTLKFENSTDTIPIEDLVENILNHLYCEYKNSLNNAIQVRLKSEVSSYHDRKPYLSQLENYCVNICQAAFNKNLSILNKNDFLSLIYKFTMKRIFAFKDLNANKSYITACVTRFVFSLVKCHLNLSEIDDLNYLRSLLCDLLAHTQDSCLVILTSLILVIPEYFFAHLFKDRSDFLSRTVECLLWAEVNYFLNSRWIDGFLKTFKSLTNWALLKQSDATKATFLIEDITHDLLLSNSPTDSAWSALSLLSASRNLTRTVHSFVDSHLLSSLVQLNTDPTNYSQQHFHRVMRCCESVCVTYSCREQEHSILFVKVIRQLSKLIVTPDSPLKSSTDRMTLIKTLLKVGFLEPALSGATFLFWLEKQSHDDIPVDIKNCIHTFLAVYNNKLSDMKNLLSQFTKSKR